MEHRGNDFKHGLTGLQANKIKLKSYKTQKVVRSRSINWKVCFNQIRKQISQTDKKGKLYTDISSQDLHVAHFITIIYEPIKQVCVNETPVIQVA